MSFSLTNHFTLVPPAILVWNTSVLFRSGAFLSRCITFLLPSWWRRENGKYQLSTWKIRPLPSLACVGIRLGVIVWILDWNAVVSSHNAARTRWTRRERKTKVMILWRKEMERKGRWSGYWLKYCVLKLLFSHILPSARPDHPGLTQKLHLVRSDAFLFPESNLVRVHSDFFRSSANPTPRKRLSPGDGPNLSLFRSQLLERRCRSRPGGSQHQSLGNSYKHRS